MGRIFNPFTATLDVFGTRKKPIVPIPTASQLQNTNVTVYPLFRGTPPFFARYALVLLSLNIMVTGNMVYECMAGGELYFNPFSNTKFSETRDQITSSPSPSSSTSTSTSTSPSSKSSPTPSSSSSTSTSPETSTPTTPQTEKEKPSKPFWRRVSFAAFHVGLGGCIAAFLLSQRARSLRSITIVRSSSSPSPSPSPSPFTHPKTPSNPRTKTTLYLQSSGHPTGHAHAFPLSESALAPTKMNKDLLVVHTRDAGKFFFEPGARGSVVGGKEIDSLRTGTENPVVEGGGEEEGEGEEMRRDKDKAGKLAKLNVLKIWKELGGKVERISQ